ncbi:MAG: hypothetical protein C5B47_00020 [Verrucomicrobia bacterium]|nr:MAG: hypothetical protein C5B47_00020 [Verrucomicrobiota bacterium]
MGSDLNIQQYRATFSHYPPSPNLHLKDAPPPVLFRHAKVRRTFGSSNSGSKNIPSWQFSSGSSNTRRWTPPLSQIAVETSKIPPQPTCSAPSPPTEETAPPPVPDRDYRWKAHSLPHFTDAPDTPAERRTLSAHEYNFYNKTFNSKNPRETVVGNFQETYKQLLKESNPHLLEKQIRKILDRINKIDTSSPNQKLDLSGLEIRKLPPCPYLKHILSHCNEVDLSNNQLEDLGDDVESDKERKLSDQSAHSLFHWHSSKLTSLNVSNNPSLTRLPKGVYSSGNLRELKINDTSIDLKKELQRVDVQWLSKLERLEASKTPTNKTNYTKLTALQHLKIEGTNIKEIRIPPSLNSLDASHCLNLSNIKGLQGAHTLKNLTLKECSHLKKLHKQSFIKNTSLENIDISYTRMRDIPDLSFQKKLKSFLAAGTPIPDSRLSSLKDTPVQNLDLSHNDKRKNFPAWLFSLKNLNFLDYSHTNIKEIPRDLKNLRVKSLILDGTRLQKLPAAAIDAGYDTPTPDKDDQLIFKWIFEEGDIPFEIQMRNTPVEKRLRRQLENDPTPQNLSNCLFQSPRWWQR